MIFEEYWKAHGQECVEELRRVIQNAFEAGRDACSFQQQQGVMVVRHERKPLFCAACGGIGKLHLAQTNETYCPECGGLGFA